MNAKQYEEWTRFYDPNNLELLYLSNVLCNHYKVVLNDPLDIWNGKKVLEIGCGTGRFTERIIDRISLLYGIDPDKERLDILNSKLCKYKDKITTFDKTLYELIDDTFMWEKFDIIVFSWSWAYIDENNDNYEKRITIDTAINCLKPEGAILVTMVVDGDYEKLCNDIRRDYSLDTYSDDLERNKKSISLLHRICALDDSIPSTYFELEFDFKTIENAAKQIENDVGFSVEDINTKYLKGKTRFSDVVECVLVKYKEHKRMVLNYKLCDGSSDCEAQKVCYFKKTGAIITIDVKGKNRLTVLQHLCVGCGLCTGICELFSSHRTWSEYYEKLRSIEKLKENNDYMDDFYYGTSSGSPNKIIKKIADCIDLFEKNDIIILEVVDSDKYASSFDSVRIIDLIGRTCFERYYYKFIIKDIGENERERLLDVLNVSRIEPPFLIAKKNKNKKIILSGHFNVKYEKDNRSYDTKIEDIREKLESLMEDE